MPCRPQEVGRLEVEIRRYLHRQLPMQWHRDRKRRGSRRRLRRRVNKLRRQRLRRPTKAEPRPKKPSRTEAKVTELRTKAKAKAISTVRRLPRRLSPSIRKSVTAVTTATSAPKGPIAPVRMYVRFAKHLTLRRVVKTSD